MNAYTVNHVRSTKLILDKVTLVSSFSKVVISNFKILIFGCVQVSNKRINVSKRFNTIFSPTINHTIPVRVMLQINLPIPNKSSSFNIVMLTSPILHPDACHRKSKIFHLLVFFFDKSLSSSTFAMLNNTNNSTLLDPRRQWLHHTSDLRDFGNKVKRCLTIQ